MSNQMLIAPELEWTIQLDSLPPNAIEMHIHSSEVSPCALAKADEVVRRCVEKGYAGMVMTDHFSGCHAARLGDLSKIPWENRVRFFLTGYKNAKNAAPAGFVVLLGMELRFEDGTDNDFLVYGFDESFLFEHPHFDQLDLRTFQKLKNKYDLTIVQAHPFRFDMTIVNPILLDGVEVYNGNSHHDSHNAIANAWADRYYGLLKSSGSDYHGGDTGDGREPGGLVFQEPVQNMQQLIRQLRSGAYTLLQ
ncbi:MAG: PHP domain-containing protein [Oscillospiraceae bacterium]|jgi:predicted metal-dependent phosphoesterase TrpH|nr:PHP domain-containing protein [Oscillospiraceae bacterium]